MPDDSPTVASQDDILKERVKALPMADLIKHIPLQDLVQEIRRRQLSTNINGTLVVNPEGVEFSITKMPWPEGEYEILIHFVKEIKHEEGVANDSEK